MSMEQRIMRHRGWFYVYQQTESDTWKRIDKTASRTYQEAEAKMMEGAA